MISKSTKIFFVLGLGLYFLYHVLANIPATLLAATVHNSVPVVWLNGVEGTVWNGRAGSAQVDVKPHELPLGTVRWQLKPLSLLALSPCAVFDAKQPGQTFTGELCHSATGTSTVKNATADGSMALLNSLVNTELRGAGSLEVQRAEFNKNQVRQLSAQLTWQNARIFVVDEWLSLGTIAAKLKENGQGGISAEIYDVDAPMKMSVMANWMPEDGWTAEGTVIPNKLTPQKIVQGLQLFGEEIEPGTYKFAWK